MFVVISLAFFAFVRCKSDYKIFKSLTITMKAVLTNIHKISVTGSTSLFIQSDIAEEQVSPLLGVNRPWFLYIATYQYIF